MTSDQRIVAVSLLTADELTVASQALKRVYPIPEDGSFEPLLRAIERAAGKPRAGSARPVE